MGKYLKALMVVALLAAALPLTAGAVGVPLLDCRLDYQEFTAPGIVADANDEDIYIYCKNKGDVTGGDAGAYTVTISVVSPTFTAAVYTALVGTVAMDGSFYNRIDLAVDETAVPGTKFDVDVTVEYTDVALAAMAPVIETATLNVRNLPEITVIGDHQSSAFFAPGGQVIYSRSSDDSLASYDLSSGIEVTLVLAGGTYTCNSHPALSPNGKLVAFQRYNNVTFYAEIWVMNLDGTNLQQVAADGSFCWGWPLWADNETLVIRADNSAPQAENWFTVNKDGSDLRLLTNEDYTFTPHADVALVGGVPMGIFQMEDTSVLYNIKTRVQLMTVPSLNESGMGEFRPGSASLIFKDDWPNAGDLWTVDFKGKKKPLTLHTVVNEFQISTDADTISLDQDDILKVISVVRADDPKGVNYAVEPFIFQRDNASIDLLDPLSGSTPALRTGVLVSYVYAEGDSNCYAKPHWGKGGGFFVYQYDFGSLQDVWAMDANGKNRIRLTFDDEGSSGDSRNLPLISAEGNALLISSNGTLEYIKLPFNVGAALGTGGGGGSDSSSGCSAVPAGAIPNVWTMLVLLSPLAAGIGLRKRLRK